MKILTFEDRESWLEARKGKITGSRLNDIVVKRGTGKKKGYYELIAERLVLEESIENPLDRGLRLESEAIRLFSDKTGKKIETGTVLWQREDNTNIAISPDGYVKGKKIKEAVEVKCLNTASHLEAYLTKQVPSEYEMQILQYFIVNDHLETVYMVFYEPRLSHTFAEHFYLEINRNEKEREIETYRAYQDSVLTEIEDIVKSLTF